MRSTAAHVPATAYVPFVLGESETVFGPDGRDDMHMLPVDLLCGRMSL
jgi:hypothetical protein